ncbi:MAG: cupin domain-containing protein [candidate division Zixibacteria bacterium]|nr:cupin domain-containing protein [candidate division Zixibacteria bacterium]
MDWAFYEIDDLRTQQAAQGRLYLEFLRIPTLSMGLYVLKAGTADPQTPHTRDETYYVVKGNGMFRVADEERSVQTGSVLFVRAGVEHRFHSITEDMEILVFFEESRPR